MVRPRWAALVLVATACGESADDRPLELDYLTQAIFAPTCGATQCHSTFVQAANLAFDTPQMARRALVDGGLILFDSTQYDPNNARDAALIHWITDTDPFGLGIGRMPFDAPMPNKDVELLIEWIDAAAPGAQCNPDLNNGMACNNTEVVQCNADWTFGARVQLCTQDCVQGVCQ